MQQLIRRLGTGRARDDRGATAVLVAVLMVPLLAMAAITVDFGSLYFERGQLQNGADAAALGIAQSCSRGSTCSAAAAGVAGAANLNDAIDSLQTIGSVTFPTSRSVHVQTVTRTASGGAGMAHPFVSAVQALIGRPVSAATTVRASADARWGFPNSGTVTLPLAFSLCGLQTALASGAKQLLRSDQNNGSPSCAGADGHPIAGGFGWLDGSGCTATITGGSLVSSDQGNDLPSRCSSLITSPDSLNGRILEVPVFDCAQSTAGICLGAVGSHSGTSKVASYHIYGFAAFKIAGHRITGSDTATDPSYTGTLRCTGNCRGIQGTFVHWSFPGDTGGTPGPDLGTYAVSLSK